MTRPGSASAPKGAAGNGCRSGLSAEARGPEWVIPYRRAQRALDSAAKLIYAAIHAVLEAGRSARQRPVRNAWRLNRVVRGMGEAKRRLGVARRDLDAATEALAREPDQQRGDAPEIMEMAAARCEAVAKYIPFALTEAVLAQLEVLGGLQTGELVPERPSDGRLRIVLAPRPLFVRAFLTSRQPRVSDRIAPALSRRRRTPRPAEVRVPRRNLRGRAPPLSSTCAL